MSGSAEGAAGPGAGRGLGRRRGIWVGLAIGVVAVSGALAAVLYGGDGGADGSGSAARQGEDPNGPVEVSHEFPASYGGQVWITISAADDAPRSVTIRWGPWERRLVHESDGPVSYWFTKNPPQPGDENVPATVRIEPRAEVEFAQGTPPVGAVDASTEWDPAADAPDEAAAD